MSLPRFNLAPKSACVLLSLPSVHSQNCVLSGIQAHTHGRIPGSFAGPYVCWLWVCTLSHPGVIMTNTSQGDASSNQMLISPFFSMKLPSCQALHSPQECPVLRAAFLRGSSQSRLRQSVLSAQHMLALPKTRRPPQGGRGAVSCLP